MFNSTFKEGQPEPRVDCDVRADVLEALLPWFYGEEVTVRKEQLLPALAFANMALVDPLKENLESLLEDSCDSDDYPQTLDALMMLDNCEMIFAKILSKLFCQLDKTNDLAKFTTFLKLPRPVVEEYFTRHPVPVVSEDKILEAILYWWLYDATERATDTLEILHACLRTDEVSSEHASKLRKHLRSVAQENPGIMEFLADLPRPPARLAQLRFETGPCCNAFVLYIQSSSGIHIQQYVQLGQIQCHKNVRCRTYASGRHTYPESSYLVDLGGRYMVCQLKSQTLFCMDGNVDDSTKVSARRWLTDGDVIPVSGAISKQELVVAVRSTKGLQFYLLTKAGEELIGTTKHPAATSTEKPVHFASYCNKLFMFVFGQRNESIVIVWDKNMKKKPRTYELVLPKVGKRFEACQRNQFLVLLSSGKFHLFNLEEMLSSKQKTVEPKTFSSPESDVQQLDSTSDNIGTKICVYGPYLLALSILPSLTLSIRVCKLNDVIGQSKVTSHVWRKCGIMTSINTSSTPLCDVTKVTFHGVIADAKCLPVE